MIQMPHPIHSFHHIIEKGYFNNVVETNCWESVMGMKFADFMQAKLM